MSVEILHGSWLPATRRFFLWGEAREMSRRKGRGAKKPPHPFAATPDELKEYLAHHNLPVEVEEGTQTILLPSVAGMPLPSPELLATGAIAEPKEKSQLTAWQLVGLALPVGDAIDLLLRVGAVRGIGDDLRAWNLAALVAMEIVAGQQLVPALGRDGYQLRATWRPRPDAERLRKIAVIARNLPPLSRALAADPETAFAPRRLLDDFMAAAVDATVREMPLRPLMAPTTPGGKWLAALLGLDATIDLKGAEADELYKGWQTWSRQEFIAGDDVFRVTFRLEPPEKEKDPWSLLYLLQANDDPSLLVPASSVWRQASNSPTFLNRRFEHPQEKLLAALGYAARMFPPLEASLRSPAPARSELTAAEAFTFLKEASPLLEASGFGVLVPAWWTGNGAKVGAKARAKATGSGSETKGKMNFETLVEFDWQVTLGEEEVNRAEFERLVALKMPLVRVRGKWVVLDPEHLRQALSFFDRKKGKDKESLLEAAAMLLGEEMPALPEGIEFSGVEASGPLRDMLGKLRNADKLDLLPVSSEFAGQLRPYQVRGYSWLAFLRRFGFGACLADDMGLGKTPQTIALLLHEREKNAVTTPSLLICPTSVVGNWLRELGKFAPSLRVMVHHGPNRKQGEEFAGQAADVDVVLSSYPLLARDQETLAGVKWATVVLDEAQNIKNASTKQAQAARALKSGSRVALTGTPVENRLVELWSIFSFLNPGYLGNEQQFRRKYARPIERTGDPAARDQLRKLTAPFILRRLKTDKSIITDLPDKMEMKVYCPLTREQATLYEAVVQDALKKIEAAEAEGDNMMRRGMVLAMLMRLKQVCNHPAQFLQDGSALPGRSGKLARLTEMIEEVYANNDRALIFSQFSSFGMMLRQYLGETFYDDILFLHGQTPMKERDAMVRRFSAPDGPRLFIISLKAGGVGLNLTQANHVFHYDRWWNPAVENQATDRAFRIGQTRNVQVHKFICGGTLEDHIDEMIEGKRALAESVIGADESWLTELSTTQLRSLVTLRQAQADKAD